MGDKSKIEWTDATWNPIIGCSPVSAGCDNCYAERVAARFSVKKPREGALVETSADIEGYYYDVINHEGQWNGKTELKGHKLPEPLRWRKPRTVFVCSMGDLFHESVPDEWIDKVMGIIASAYRHRFMILTKRPRRMLQYFEADARNELIASAAGFANENGDAVADFVLTQGLPIPNLALGVSIEDQKTADERIPILLQTPAAYRFVSYEPALGLVDFGKYFGNLNYRKCDKCSMIGEDGLRCPHCGQHATCSQPIDLVITGGESGPKARPMHPDWARSVREQCEAAGVPFHFKQWGEWKLTHESRCNDPGIKGKPWHNFDPDTSVCRLGKRAAGRLLAGKEHNGKINWR